MACATILNRRGERLYSPLSGPLPRFQGISGLGLVLYSLSISFAAVDWVMSLDPHWGSTIYGLIFIAGQGLSALAFCVIMLTLLTRYSPYREIIKPTQFHDLGKLMLAFVMLFAYFSFSQWLIIWAGNLPEEIGWFLNRIRGGWGVVALIIILFHFALPFALLLSRERKRAGSRLIGMAIFLMFMRRGRHLLVRGAQLRPRARTLLPEHLVHRRRRLRLADCGWATSSTTSASGRCCRSTSRRYRTSCTKDRDMATDNSNHDPLRNPQVDYERSDLSPSGILWFLIGLFIAGVFIELVIWGMFRFMARSEVLFPQGQKNPMTVQNSKDDARHSGSVLQNTPGVNLNVFPEPRLQTNDAGEMAQYLNSENGAAGPAAAVHGCQRRGAYPDRAGDAVDRRAGIAGASEVSAAELSSAERTAKASGDPAAG